MGPVTYVIQRKISLAPALYIILLLKQTHLTFCRTHTSYTYRTVTFTITSEGHHKRSVHACEAYRNHSYIMHRVLGTAGMGGGKDQQGDAHQAWTSQRFRPLPCYRCRMGGGAGERRYLTLDTRRFAAAPLSPVGPAEVAWALGYTGSCKIFGPDPSGTSASSFGGFGRHGLSQATSGT